MRLTTAAERDLRAVPRSERPRLLAALDRLRGNPGLGKRLRGEFAERRSFRVGDYRIIYHIAERTIVVTSIGHRATVYRNP